MSKVKDQVGFWRWLFTKIFSLICDMWNEGRIFKAFICMIIYYFVIFFILFLIGGDQFAVWNPYLVALLMLSPLVVISFVGLYELYEYDTEGD